MRILLSFSILLMGGLCFAQPANDKCVDAQPVVIPAGGTICITSSSMNANTSGELHQCKTSAVREVWFTYIATGSNNTVTVTPIGANPIGTPVVTMRDDPCGSLTQDGCGNFDGNMAVVSNGYTPGQQVFIDVGGLTADGEFELCITSGAPAPTPGNTCQNAAWITGKDAFTVNNLNGLSSSGLRPMCFGKTVEQDIWYKFKVDQTGDLNWEVTPHGSDVELDWAVYDITDGCPNLQDTSDISSKEYVCNYNFSGPGNEDAIGMIDSAIKSQVLVPTTPCPKKGVTNTQYDEYCSPQQVQSCRTYAIVIDNFDGNNQGFDFKWGGDFTIKSNPQADCTVGIRNVIRYDHNINVFPNPVSDILTMDFTGLGVEEFNIVNAVGQLVLTKTVTNEIQTINVEELNINGLHFIIAKTENGLVTKKFVAVE